MKSVPVTYFDGKISTGHSVLLTLDEGQVVIRGEGIELFCPVSDLTIPPGVGAVRRTIRLSDGGMCEVEDGALLAELEQGRHSTVWRVLHRWEKSLPLAMIALGLTALVVFLFIRYGVPTLAKRAAFALPVATEKSLGDEAVATLDRLLMKPTTLAKTRQDELTALFRRVAGPDKSAAAYRLEFRSAPVIGPNAFALPYGIVVMTDQLVELAKNDDELAAILAHELGHVRQRHLMRHVLQSSTAGLIVATLTGDLVSITSLAATVPTMLVDSSFSREFEREADDAAMVWMHSAGVNPRRYAEILGRLQGWLDARSGEAFDKKHPARNYLSSHPDTGDRIRRIMRDVND